jgi:putative heme-binding domain-containing protein
MTTALLLLAALPAAPVNDVKLPPGFTAQLYSDRDLANDIYTMTIDDVGRVFVAGRGYVKQLVDDDGDGRADRAVVLLNNLKDGPMGLLAEGDSLYVVADGGLKRYSGLNTRTLGKPELIYAVKTSGEHEAHAIRRGPDGWLYLMCGNMSGVKKEHLDPDRSPVKNPIAGSLLRIRPDGKSVEAVADGFRNAYGFDFNLEGEAFTFDSDNERCVGLPWYEPCRFYHVVPGGNYGWRSPQLSQTWRKPPYFADVVPPIGTTGRGSPTGVACYRNTLFPSPYRGGFFIADWTFGKIWFVPLMKQHSSYVGKPEVFLEAVGESGFAPTALAVHPKTGELFVSIGGRGTRGAVYRIGHERGGPVAELPIANRSLEWHESSKPEWLADAVGNDALKRRHALDAMLRYRDKLGWGEWLGDAVKPNLSHDDPLVRAAAARMVVHAAAPVGSLSDTRARLTIALYSAADQPELALKDALDVLATPRASADDRLLAARVIQLALGDLTEPAVNGTVAEGYSFRKPVPRPTAIHVMKVINEMLKRPREEQHLAPELIRELTRIAGALGPLKTPEEDRDQHWMLYSLRSAEKEPSLADDIHMLAVYSRLSPLTLSDFDTAIASRLLGAARKAAKEKIVRDRNWPLRYEELCAALIPEHLHLAGTFRSWQTDIELPEHLPIMRHLRMKPEEKAVLILQLTAKRDIVWNAEMLQITSELSNPRFRELLDALWLRGGMEEVILPYLPRVAKPEDGPRFIVGLRSMNPEVVRISAAALLKLEPQKDQADVLAAILALRKLPEEKASAGPRDALIALLKNRTEQNHAGAKAWAAWFTTAHPELAAKLNSADGFDAAAWAKREPNIPWATGDAVKGRAVFAKATCASCHDGGGAIGPSLAGVGKRFSREDLLAAVLQPSKDVSPRYRPTRISTTDGKVHIGMIVYEAVSGVILQTGPDSVVRIDGTQIESQKLLETSLMPAGLLEKLTDAEIADLMAYLRSG